MQIKTGGQTQIVDGHVADRHAHATKIRGPTHIQVSPVQAKEVHVKQVQARHVSDKQAQVNIGERHIKQQSHIGIRL